MPAIIADETHIDAGIALHYGNPLAEQRLLKDGAFVDLSNRGVVTVTGPDRLSWLHSLTTQYVEGLAARTSVQNLILSPHGHIEHDLHEVDDGQTTWLSVEPGTAEALVSFLNKMRFLMQVEVTNRSGEYAVVGSLEPHNVTEAVIMWVAGDAYTNIHHDDDRYLPLRPEAWSAHEYVIPRNHLAAFLADKQVAGVWAWEALRIAAGVPRLGKESDHKTIPHEIGLINAAVHLNKGCYRGQETIARVHNLGRPPRRLVLLHLDGSDNALPVTGDVVIVDGKDVGRITSSAHHYELGPIALAVIKRSVDPHASVLVNASNGDSITEVAASQEVLVQP